MIYCESPSRGRMALLGAAPGGKDRAVKLYNGGRKCKVEVIPFSDVQPEAETGERKNEGEIEY